MRKGRLVEITAQNVESKYGIVVEEDRDTVLLKVGIKKDRNPILGDKLLLGKKWIKERR